MLKQKSKFASVTPVPPATVLKPPPYLPIVAKPPFMPDTEAAALVRQAIRQAVRHAARHAARQVVRQATRQSARQEARQEGPALESIHAQGSFSLWLEAQADPVCPNTGSDVNSGSDPIQNP